MPKVLLRAVLVCGISVSAFQAFPKALQAESQTGSPSTFGSSSTSGFGNSGSGFGNEAEGLKTPATPAEPESQAGETVPEGEVAGEEQATVADPETESPENLAEGEVTTTPPTSSPGLIPEAKAPTGDLPEAKGNGSIGYQFAIDVPAFRGLEPKIELQYSSSRKSKTGGLYQGWLGYGWALNGFDVIERARPRQGVPAYNPSDVFLLNGIELVPCQTGSASPSCMTGGTHSTENESYLRIRFDSAANTWDITDRTGTETLLAAVGTIAGAGTLTPGTDAHDIAYRYRWLVTTVTDTHGNQVNYAYSCPTMPVCYPQSVTYSGTEVRFYRETRPDYILAANGRTLSQISDRIRTITVSVSGSLRAAYALEYDQAPVSNASRLVKVRQFGKDVALDAAGAITAGTERPETQLTYADYAAQYDTLSIGPSLEEEFWIYEDLNSDGKHEVLFSNNSWVGITSFTAANGSVEHGSIERPHDGTGLENRSHFGRFNSLKKEKYWAFIGWSWSAP